MLLICWKFDTEKRRTLSVHRENARKNIKFLSLSPLCLRVYFLKWNFLQKKNMFFNHDVIIL